MSSTPGSFRITRYDEHIKKGKRKEGKGNYKSHSIRSRYRIFKQALNQSTLIIKSDHRVGGSPG